MKCDAQPGDICCKSGCTATISPDGHFTNAISHEEIYFIEGITPGFFTGIYHNSAAWWSRISVNVGLKVMTMGATAAVVSHDAAVLAAEAAANAVESGATAIGSTVVKKTAASVLETGAASMGKTVVKNAGTVVGVVGTTTSTTFSNIVGHSPLQGTIGEIWTKIKGAAGLEDLSIMPYFKTRLNVYHPQAICTNDDAVVSSTITFMSAYFDNVDIFPLVLSEKGAALVGKDIGTMICFGVEKVFFADIRRAFPLLSRTGSGNAIRMSPTSVNDFLDSIAGLVKKNAKGHSISDDDTSATSQQLPPWESMWDEPLFATELIRWNAVYRYPDSIEDSWLNVRKEQGWFRDPRFYSGYQTSSGACSACEKVRVERDLCKKGTWLWNLFDHMQNSICKCCLKFPSHPSCMKLGMLSDNKRKKVDTIINAYKASANPMEEIRQARIVGYEATRIRLLAKNSESHLYQLKDECGISFLQMSPSIIDGLEMEDCGQYPPLVGMFGIDSSGSQIVLSADSTGGDTEEEWNGESFSERSTPLTGEADPSSLAMQRKSFQLTSKQHRGRSLRPQI